jgi:hypothetical protein
LWARATNKYLFSGNSVIGIKGIPGRGGIGCGHRNKFSSLKDLNYTLLQEKIKDDYLLYLPFKG